MHVKFVVPRTPVGVALLTSVTAETNSLGFSNNLSLLSKKLYAYVAPVYAATQQLHNKCTIFHSLTLQAACMASAEEILHEPVFVVHAKPATVSYAENMRGGNLQ